MHTELEFDLMRCRGDKYVHIAGPWYPGLVDSVTHRGRANARIHIHVKGHTQEHS